MVDLDGDGYVDILSGSWPGELFLFRGGPDRTFAAPVKIKDAEGEAINIGGGFRDDQNYEIFIAGDARFETTDEGRVIIYNDQRIEIPSGTKAAITGTASAVHATDWDGDDDLDLIVGEGRGRVYLLVNRGSAREYEFAPERQLQAGGEPLSVGIRAGPFAADWDGDGRLDLLVGAGDGSVWYFRNTGTSGTPELAAGQQLVPPGSLSTGDDVPETPERGILAKICAADWNGDGRLDLLVGDRASMKPVLPEPTPEVQAEREKLQAEVDRLQTRISKLSKKEYGITRAATAAERKQAREERIKLLGQRSELEKKLPPVYENHGWVWLFVRKPEAPHAGR